MINNINLKNISKSSDLINRILFTVAALFVYRIGAYVPLPGLDPLIIQQIAERHLSGGGLLTMFNMFSGGALSRMTIFALNIMPYISASIMVQLLTMVFPTWGALKKEGENGRKKLNQYTKYLTIGVSTVQALGITTFLINTQGSPVILDPFKFQIIAVLTLISGTLFLVWLGEQITSRGIGNGSSLIIYAGIVSGMPSNVAHIFEMGKVGAISGAGLFTTFAVAIGAILFVVFMERAQRKVAIHYPQRQMMMAQGQNLDSSHLPLKINSAGVIPPIFAYSLLSLPLMLCNFLANKFDNEYIHALVSFFNRGGVLFSLILLGLIMFFSFFYTAVVFNPEETADNLKKAGGYIPGVRPGKATAEYFDYILTRLTVVGALYMGAVCLLPDLMNYKFGIQFLFNGGTAILIVVGVTMDTVTQIMTNILSHQYRGVLRKAEKRRR